MLLVEEDNFAGIVCYRLTPLASRFLRLKYHKADIAVITVL